MFVSVCTADISQPTTLKAPFIEQFVEDLGPDSRWTVSQATKQTPVGDETFSYVGTWAVEEPEVFPGIKGDKGLVLSEFRNYFASRDFLLIYPPRVQGCPPCHLDRLREAY